MFLLFSMLILIPSPAFAQSELFIRVFGGLSSHPAAEMSLKLDHQYYKLSGVQFTSRSFNFPLYYGVSAGWRNLSAQLPFGVAVEFIHDKIYVQRNQPVRIQESDNPQFIPGERFRFRDILSDFSMSHGHNFLLLKFAVEPFRTRLFNRELVLTTGVAAGGLIPHVESHQHGIAKEQYEWHFPAFLTDGIFRWAAGNHLALIAGFKIGWDRIRDAQVSGGSLSTDLWSFHFVFGVEVKGKR